MKQFQSQLQRKAKTVSLTAAERRDVKERLLTYMEYHPLPAELRTEHETTTATESVSAEPFTLVQVPFKALFKTIGVAFAVIVLVVPFVAERAVPGDTLYAVKVQFNEELRSTLTFTGAEKVEWETERLNRRIAEARLLASEGRLTDAIEAEVAAAVKEHSETAQREIAAMRTVDADGAAIAAIAFNTTLEVQASALRGKEADEMVTLANESRSTDLLATVIDESRTDSQPTASTTPPGFEKLLARVEQNTTRIYELREAVLPAVSEERVAEIDRRISDIETILADAIAAAQSDAADDNSEARHLLVDAMQHTQKLIVYITELEVIKTVDIDTVVPVILTEEEKTAKQAELLQELTDKQTQIGAALELEEDAGVVEKAALALETIDEGITELASTTAYLTFVERATSLIVLADDTLNSFQADEVEVEASDEELSDTTGSSSATTTVVTATTSDVVVDEDDVATTTTIASGTPADAQDSIVEERSTTSVETE